MRNRLLSLLFGALAMLAPTLSHAISNYYPTFGRGITDSTAYFRQTPDYSQWLPTSPGTFKYEDSFAGAKIYNVSGRKHHYSKDQPFSKQGTFLATNSGAILRGTAPYDSLGQVTWGGADQRWWEWVGITAWDTLTATDADSFKIYMTPSSGGAAGPITLRYGNIFRSTANRTLVLPLVATNAFMSEGNLDRQGRFIAISNAGMDKSCNVIPDSICIVDVVNWKVGPAYAVPRPPASLGESGLVAGHRWGGNIGDAYSTSLNSSTFCGYAPGTLTAFGRDTIERVQIDNHGVASDTIPAASGIRYRGLGWVKYGGRGEANRIFEFNTHPDSLTINFWHKFTVDGVPTSAERDSTYAPRFWPPVKGAATGGVRMTSTLFGHGWTMGAKHADCATHPTTYAPILVANAKEHNNAVRNEPGTTSELIGTNLITGTFEYLTPYDTQFLHGSARATSRLGWVYITAEHLPAAPTYAAPAERFGVSTNVEVADDSSYVADADVPSDDPVANVSPGGYLNEIFAVPVDGSRRMQRLVHVFSTSNDYESEAHGVPNRDGTKVVFSSDNMDATLSKARMYVAEVHPQTWTVSSDAQMTAALSDTGARWGDQVNVTDGTYTVAPHPTLANPHPNEFYRLVFNGNIDSSATRIMPSPAYGSGGNVNLPSKVTWRGLAFNNGFTLYKPGTAAAYDSVANCYITGGNVGFYNVNRSGYSANQIGSGNTLARFTGPGFTHTTDYGNFVTGNNMVLRDSISNTGSGHPAGSLMRIGTPAFGAVIPSVNRAWTVSDNVIRIARLGRRSSSYLYEIEAGARPKEDWPLLNGVSVTGITGSTFARNSFTIADSSTGTNTNTPTSALMAFSIDSGADSNTFERDTISVSGTIAQVNLGNTYNVRGPEGAGYNAFRALWVKNTTPFEARLGRPGVEMTFMNNATLDSNVVVQSDSTGSFGVNAMKGVNYIRNNAFYARNNAGGAFVMDIPGINGSGATLELVNNIFYTGSGGASSYALVMRRANESSPVMDRDYNLYSNYDGNALIDHFTIPGGPPTGPARYGSGCAGSTDCHSVIGSPMWTDSTVADFDPGLELTSAALGVARGGADIGPRSTTPDTLRPAAISTLNGLPIHSACIMRLEWTVTGDDSLTGTVASYDIRRSLSPITEANFSSATVVPQSVVPAIAGTVQSILVNLNTESDRTYYYAMKVADERGQWSAMSNLEDREVHCSGGGSGKSEIDP